MPPEAFVIIIVNYNSFLDQWNKNLIVKVDKWQEKS